MLRSKLIQVCKWVPRWQKLYQSNINHWLTCTRRHCLCNWAKCLLGVFGLVKYGQYFTYMCKMLNFITNIFSPHKRHPHTSLLGLQCLEKIKLVITCLRFLSRDIFAAHLVFRKLRQSQIIVNLLTAFSNAFRISIKISLKFLCNGPFESRLTLI